MVAVHFGGVLAGVGAQDPAGVLHQPALERDGGGEDEGVQGGAVEAFTGVRAGRHDQQRPPSSTPASRAVAAVRALAPMPPRKHHRVRASGA